MTPQLRPAAARGTPWPNRVLGAAALSRLLGQPEPTQEQAAVIEAPPGPGLVVAGAGSGKTETMAARVVWLVANGHARPEQVLGLTFTRKAAGELAARIGHRVRQLATAGVVAEEVVLGGEPTVSTYHAYAARIVAEHGVRLGIEPTARVLTDAVRWQYAARVVQAYDGDMSHVTLTPGTVTAELLDLADELGEHFVTPEDLRRFTDQLVDDVHALPGSARKTGPYADVVKALGRQRARLQLLPLVERYLAGKRAGEAMDYGDQMGAAARLADSVPEIGLLERARYAAVLLDEYQDTSHSQLVLLRSLFGEGHPVTAVGDPCQSIYGWRGASAGSLQRFPEHFPVNAHRSPPDSLRSSLRCDAHSPAGFADGTLLPAPAPVRQLSTSWRNDGQILDLANRISEPLRRDGAVVPVLRSRPGREDAGTVRCALLETAEDEARWLAEALGSLWASVPRPTVAVLTRRRSQQRLLETALRAAGLPVEVLGLGGLLDTPEVLDVVSTLRVAVDPSAGDALLRLLGGARWRIGPRDLVALGRRACQLAAVDRGTAERPLTVDPDTEGSVVDALDDLGEPAAYSTVGHARLTSLRGELRALRQRLDQPLPDLLADIERTIGLDVEIAVRRPGEQELARGHLDAFLDIAADFATDLSGQAAGGLVEAFLGYLRAAEEHERGLEAGVVERHPEAVQILTVHGAKGLEWDVVAVPGLTKAVFPSKDAGGEVWTTRLGMVPYPLRGDSADLPRWDPARATDQKDADTGLKAFRQGARAIGLREERRLAYVAFTRARGELLCSGYWWDDAKGARGASELLAEVHEHCSAGGGTVQDWEPPPADGVTNPRKVEIRSASWPFDPLGARRDAVTVAATAVRSADGAGDLGEWAVDLELLLAERSVRARDTEDVDVPAQLSVSQLVALRRDPARLAQQIHRPMPYPPAPLARRGTAFHLWLEQRFGAAGLLDLDELPGAEDAGADDADLVVLREAFLASAWADRTPVEVEVPFELRLAGLALRGRMDAVFVGPDGRYDVVDWKTGQPPSGLDAEAAAVQLAAYRLAWAELAGVGPGQVSAAFHYVRQARTVRPVDLLDAAGLRALLEELPLAG